MAFRKGKIKTGGREVGVTNKKKLLIDAFAMSVCDGGMERFQEELEKLSGKDYVYAYLTLFEYVKPKLSRLDATVTGNISIVWNEEKTYEAEQETDQGL